MSKLGKQNWVGQALGGILGIIAFVVVIRSSPPTADELDIDNIKTASQPAVEQLDDEDAPEPEQTEPAEITPPTIKKNDQTSQLDTLQKSKTDIAVANSKSAPVAKLLLSQAFGPTLPPPVKLNIILRRGEALIDKIKKAGVSSKSAYLAITAIDKQLNLRKLQIGQEIQVEIDQPLKKGEKVKLHSLAIRSEFDTLVKATLQDDGSYLAKKDEIPTILVTMYNEGTIDDSLFLAAQRAGVPPEIIVTLIRTYSFEVDFQREIRPGDKFEVYYQRRLTADGTEIENGNIQYAKLILRNKPIPYYSYTPKDGGRADFFSGTGESARRSLMKTPLDVAVMTSNYGQRKHPVLGYTRMHKGVDFRAPTGTPIMAAGDGIVEKSRRWGSYGNYIRIKHNSTYSTAYAHLSRYGTGVREGARVKQGQIIGYSGATGRVSAAHLHYEVLVNGNQANPMKLNLPTGKKLTGGELTAFKKEQESMNTDINALKLYEAMARGDENLSASLSKSAP